MPIWGCLAPPGSSSVLRLGTIEPANQPLDVDAVVAGLGPYVGRTTRIVVVGADADRSMSLRIALVCKLLQVSVVWDAEQAVELMRASQPEVVVVDLGLPNFQGHGIVAHLATQDPVPHIVLVTNGDQAPGFAEVLKGDDGGSGISRTALLTGAAKRPDPRVRGR